MPDIIEAPYEITVRFNWDAGEKAGEVRGVHLATQTLMVDAGGLITGRIIRGEADEPKPFPPEKLQEVLGDKWAQTAAQLAVLQTEHADRRSMELRIARAQWDEEMSALRHQNKDLETKMRALKDANADLEKRAYPEVMPQP